jgi:hypothetical protein
MTLVIEAPANYEPERRYILDMVLATWLGLDYELFLRHRSDVLITLKGDSCSGHVLQPDVLFATAGGDWLTPASLPTPGLTWQPVEAAGPGALAPGQRLPVLYGLRDAPLWLRSADGNQIRLGVDVLGSAFFMLTRYEELVVGARDRYGRFPAASSVAHAGRFLELPIVDAYVELLWSALGCLWPGLVRKPRAFRLSLTHDVDRPLSFLGHRAVGLARQLGADALLRRDLALAARRLRSWTGISRGDYRLDPYNTFDFLMTVSERHGLQSAFNFLATDDASGLNGFYTLGNPWIRSLMSRIHQRGHEIGFHAGFDTYRDPERTAKEYRCLRTVASKLGVSQGKWGGRQHYLRWENPKNWANWEHAGLDYDSTPVFAEAAGFRFGTCHEFRAFHLRQRRPLRLQERPLIVMDCSLSDYMKLKPDAAFEKVLTLANECRRYGGTLTLLWHNSSLPSKSQQRRYEQLTDAVALP